MKPILIFDYDGTIHNTMVIYEKCFRATFKWLVDNNYATDRDVPITRIKSWLGINAKDMWNDFLPELSDELKEKASLMTGSAMASAIENGEAKWYENAIPTLDTLLEKGYEMYILSNCKIKYKEANYNTFNMGKWFKEFIDCESYDWAPKTEIIKVFAKKHPGNYIIIGDRNKDIECAKSCGGKSIGCLYGFGTKEELKNADYLIKDISELVNILAL